jgi:hypothetical protein
MTASLRGASGAGVGDESVGGGAILAHISALTEAPVDRTIALDKKGCCSSAAARVGPAPEVATA